MLQNTCVTKFFVLYYFVMNYSDEQLKNGDSINGRTGANTDADNEVMPKIVPAREPAPKPVVEPAEEVGNSFADDLISAIFKTTFIALSLIAMLACIIAFALPLTSMRLFNSMGLSERAVDFGEKYISRELKSHKSTDGTHTADYVDSDGNMPVLTSTPALTNDDFMEALYVCNNLSDKLMIESLKAGDDVRTKYYAERLEKYTRMYLSLSGLSAVTLVKDSENIASVPAAVRPAVYSYEHDMHVLNYRARAVLGITNRITHNNHRYTDGVMIDLSTLSNTYSDSALDTPTVQRMDEYVDYIAQLGAYLDIEFMRIGVETDLSKRDSESKIPVLSETYIRQNYGDKLDGDEFSLFIMPLKEVTETSNGFTRLYSQLGSFSRYAQWAVTDEAIPPEENGKLHQLYWLRTLSDVSRKLWYMEMLLYYNSVNLGNNHDAINQAYGTCQSYMFVNYKLTNMSSMTSCQLLEVYADKLANYIGGNN